LVVDRDGFANTVTADFDYRISDRSALEFGAGHSMRRYEKLSIFTGRLSDQDRVNGRVAYRRDISSHSSWDVRYAANYNEYKDFNNALTHNPGLGFSHQLAPSVDLSVAGGPSYIQSEVNEQNYWSYHISLRITKSFEDTYVSLFYNRRPGNSTGIGSTSDTDRIGFNLNRPLGRKTTLSAGLSWYEQRSRLDNPISLRGYQVSGRLSFLLTENLQLGVGGDFRKQDETGEFGGDRYFNYDRRRIYVTLSFLLPELARF